MKLKNQKRRQTKAYLTIIDVGNLVNLRYWNFEILAISISESIAFVLHYDLITIDKILF